MDDKKIRKKEDTISSIRDKLVNKLKWESRIGDLGKLSNSDLGKVSKEMLRYTNETSNDLKGKLQEAYKDLQDAHAFMTQKRKK